MRQTGGTSRISRNTPVAASREQWFPRALGRPTRTARPTETETGTKTIRRVCWSKLFDRYRALAGKIIPEPSFFHFPSCRV